MIITSSFGIIINTNNNKNTKFLPLKFNLARANAARITTTIVNNVVVTDTINVLAKSLNKLYPNKASL